MWIPFLDGFINDMLNECDTENAIDVEFTETYVSMEKEKVI